MTPRVRRRYIRRALIGCDARAGIIDLRPHRPSRLIEPEEERIRPGLPRDISFRTALLLYGWDVTQTREYSAETRAQIDDAWERPEVARGGGIPLWDRDARWLAELRRIEVPWATEVLVLPYLYWATVRS